MPTLDETRREQDLFAQERREQEDQAAALAAKAKSGAEQQRKQQAEEQAQHERQKESQETAPIQTPFEKQSVAPHMLAELPQQTEASRETLMRLFEHYTDNDEEDEVVDTNTVTQGDPRQGARDLLPKVIEVGDSIRDGMAADFVHDSAIVAGELDTHPRPSSQADSQVDGWGERRRRIAEGASVEPAATKIAESDADKEQS